MYILRTLYILAKSVGGTGEKFIDIYQAKVMDL